MTYYIRDPAENKPYADWMCDECCMPPTTLPAPQNRKCTRTVPNTSQFRCPTKKRRNQASPACYNNEQTDYQRPARKTKKPPPPPKQVKILQWNANGLRSKSVTLNNMIDEHDPDFVLIQETNLSETISWTPHPNYNLERRDRETTRTAKTEDSGKNHGGVLTLIRRDINYETMSKADMLSPNDGLTEAIGVKARVDQQYLTVINLYIPVVNKSEDDTRTDSFDPTFLPSTKSTYIAGDLNAHGYWDQYQPLNTRGADIEDWMDNKEMMVLNSEASTKTLNNSVPDMTICHEKLFSNSKWELLEDGLSDHLPIMTTLDVRVHPQFRAPAQWSYKKAQWDSYTAQIEEDAKKNPYPATCEKHWRSLKSMIITSAKANIPKGSRKNAKSWWCPEADASKKETSDAVKLFKKGEMTREDLNEIRAKGLKTLNELKSNAFKTFATEELNAKTEISQLFRVIRKVGGNAGSKNPGTPLLRGTRVMRTDESKADAFSKEYSNVSNIPITKEEKRKVYKDIRSSKLEDDEAERIARLPFTTQELEASIRNMKMRKACGYDGISNEMIHHLGEEGRKSLLHLINKSWKTKYVPTDWRKAIIIPIPKQGKDLKKTSSYRPISLTGCISKLMEHMVKERLIYNLERDNVLNESQAGFRTLRSTEDQVIRMSQMVHDGFQERKRTVMVLIDFSKAFDTVWRSGLIKKMIKMKIPTQYTSWISAFLTDRKAQVRYGSSTSRFRRMLNGVPQGSVLSPLLFLLYINDICDGLDVNVSLFADDLALWVQDTELERANAKIQKALHKIEEWCAEWKLQLNTEKSEVTVFSTDSHEAKYRPHLTLLGEPVQFNPTPTFLGVTFDRTLSFNAHIAKVTKKMKSRCNVLKALRGRDWGLDQSDMRQVYLTYARSAAEYCAPAWAPSTSDTQMKKLETAQNEHLRVIVNGTKTTSVHSLRVEAGVQPFQSRCEESSAISMEKSKRVPETNPRRLLADEEGPKKRLKRESWRGTALKVIRECELEDIKREPFVTVSNIAPWEEIANVTYNTDLTTGVSKKNSKEEQKQAALKDIQMINADIEIYTDGSTTECRDGGSGVTMKIREEEEDIDEMTAAGTHSSSYKAEMIGVRTSLKMICELQAEGRITEGQTVGLYTDSRSSVQRLKNCRRHHSKTLNDVQILLQKITEGGIKNITIQWIPAHCGIEGNEKADRLAEEATRLPQDDVEVDFKTVKALIKRRCKKKWIAEAKPHFARAKEVLRPKEAGLTAQEKTILARFRMGGHLPELAWYRNFITRSKEETLSDKCEQCGERETLEHYLSSCPFLAQKRSEIFGHLDPLKLIFDDPLKIAKYLRATNFLNRESINKDKMQRAKKKKPPDK